MEEASFCTWRLKAADDDNDRSLSLNQSTNKLTYTPSLKRKMDKKNKWSHD